MKKPFAVAILLGWLLLGPVAVASAASAGDVPPRPLTDRGLTNLTALTRLIGYVRFFHPGDQVAGLTLADWDALAMAGVERVEAARDPGELAASLSTLFDGIAPTVQVLPFHPSSGASGGFPEVAGAGAGPPRWPRTSTSSRGQATETLEEPQVQAEPKPPYPQQKLAKPGLEAEMEQQPRWRAPKYRPAGKLEGKVALVTRWRQRHWPGRRLPLRP